MTMFAILTKYHAPTAAKDGRISAWTQDAKMLSVPSQNTAADHLKAAQNLMRIAGITGKYTQVALPDGGAEYVVIVGEL